MRDVDDTGAAVVTGTGSAFSAGVDLKQIVNGAQSYVQEFLPGDAITGYLGTLKQRSR
jgi:enoyl-CoA hydratase